MAAFTRPMELVWFEPTDIVNAHKLFSDPGIPRPQFISPNHQELLRIHACLFPKYKQMTVDEKKDGWLEAVIELAEMVAEEIDYVILTASKHGVVIVGQGGEKCNIYEIFEGKATYRTMRDGVSKRRYSPRVISPSEVVNTSGAGDCFASGFISAMLVGLTERECVEKGFHCADCALRTASPVPNNF